MVEKISVQIGLEGADEVKQQLADIGKASTQAFDAAGDASQNAAGEIEKVGAAADKAGQSFNQVAQESLKTATAVATLVGTVAKYGVEIGLAVQKHRGWISSLVSMAGQANTVIRSLGLLEVGLGATGAAATTAAGSVLLAVAAFEALEKVATKAASGYEKLNNTLQTLAATSGESFGKLQQGEAVFGQIGISAETFRSTIAKVQETLAGIDTKNLTRGMTDIVALVSEIAAGQKGITFAGWVTAEDKVKGVAIAMKQAADSGKDATQVLLDFIRNVDLATGIKIGAAFGLSEADVDRVRRLGESVSDVSRRIAGAPPIISPEAAARFDAMRTSIQNVDSATARWHQSLSSADFASYAASFSAAMNDMKAATINAAAVISEGVGQAFRGMLAQARTDVADINAALGQLAQQTGAANLFKQMQADAVQANAAVADFIGGLMRGFGAAEPTIKAVQDRINGIATATKTAGQTAQQTGVIFTQWGTVATQGANTASAAVQQSGVIFTQWGTVASQSGDKAKASMAAAAGSAQSLSDKVAEFASKIAGITWENIKTNGVAAWNAFIAKVKEAIEWVKTLIGLSSNPVWGAGPKTPGMASGGLMGGRGTGTSDSNFARVSRGEYIMPARVVAQPGVASFLEALRRGGGIPGFAEGGFIRGVVFSGGGGLADKIADWIVTIAQANNDTRTALEQIAQSVVGVADSLTDKLFPVVSAMTDAISALSRGDGMAGGGLLGGRGTGTSDSNLAWLSRGEHIMPAHAVRQPGVLAFLEALRRSGGNLSRVLDGMGRFALGGMVPRAIPAFATGGLAGGSNVTIQFPGLPAISGLRASSSVVEQLQKAAALAQVRSGGRKPSRYS